MTRVGLIFNQFGGNNFIYNVTVFFTFLTLFVTYSSYLHYRTAVKSGAEIGPLTLRLSVSQGAPLGDIQFAPACPIEKVTLWEGFLYLMLGSQTEFVTVKVSYGFCVVCGKHKSFNDAH